MLNKDIPECTIATMIGSLSESTIKQYNSALHCWWNFCKVNKIEVYTATISDVLKFFQNQLETKQWAYGSFNSCRSALSLILPEEIGKNLQLKRFLKSVSKLRPQRPKYNICWDPQTVLIYLSSLYPNDSLSLLDLSRKLITLFALITGHRLQTFSLIRVLNIHFTESGAQIFITDSIKTSGTNAIQPCLHIPFFGQKPELCAASTLLCYVERTQTLRSPTQEYLFLTSVEPHRTATRNTLGRWIRQTLSLAGINTRIFTPHSTRHASTSAALRRGISLELIRKTAGWSTNSQTFAKFYNRPLMDSNFSYAEAILNS